MKRLQRRLRKPLAVTKNGLFPGEKRMAETENKISMSNSRREHQQVGSGILRKHHKSGLFFPVLKICFCSDDIKIVQFAF